MTNLPTCVSEDVKCYSLCVLSQAGHSHPSEELSSGSSSLFQAIRDRQTVN